MSRKPLILLLGDPKGTRTPVTGVRGQCPRPLDDGAQWCCFITDPAGLVNTFLPGKINSKDTCRRIEIFLNSTVFCPSFADDFLD